MLYYYLPLSGQRYELKSEFKKMTVKTTVLFRDSVGMVGFCARRAQGALFQTHSALTDAVFYTKISRLKHARYCSYFYDAT